MHDVESVRSALPALTRLNYLNSGTAGPLPQPAVDAMATALFADAERGRISGRRFGKIAETRQAVRAALAALVNARPEKVVLTTGTVSGLRLALATITWSVGDTVVTTNLEHPDTAQCVARLSETEELTVGTVEIGESWSPEEILAAVRAAVRPGVRAVVVSHVAYSTGAVLPIREIVRHAHAVGAVVVVDGAQAVGALVVDTDDLGADFYAFSGQKWLLGPEGTGALVIGRRDRDPVSSHGDSDARSNVLLAGLHAALVWRRGIGAEQELVAALGDRAEQARRALAQIPGVDVVTSSGHAGLISFRVDGHRAEDVALALGRARIATRAVDGGAWVRASFGFFTTHAEVDQLVTVVAATAESAS